jgi:hypothetical protein
MYNEEEDKLTEMKEKYQEVKIPEQIDDYINTGIQQANKRSKRSRTSTLTTLAAGIMIFILLASIRISPAFANYVSQIPGLDRIVTLVQGDKGLEAAVQNDFIQMVGESDSHNGITFKVDEIIADESRLIVFYSLKSEQKQEYISLSRIDIQNEAGESIIGSIGYDHHQDGIKKGEVVKGKLDIGFKKNINHPKQLTIKTKIGLSYDEAELIDEDWIVTFPVDQEKFFNNEVTYKVDKAVMVEGQQITFKEVTVYPTRIAVHVKYDEKNTKKIFSFDDLKIVNEKGEEWASINNGISAHHISENERILFLQSNYFSKPKEIYIEFSSIRAHDKDKLEVVVDLKQKKLLKSPNKQVELLEVTESGKKLNLKFLIKRYNKFDENTFYDIFGYNYHDQDGKEYGIRDGVGTSSYNNTIHSEIYFLIDKIDYQGPITFEISDYPTRISKDVRIKVK